MSWRHGTSTLLLLSLGALAWAQRPLPTTVSPGAVVEHGVARGETHAYRLMPPPGGILHLRVDQRGADVTITVRRNGEDPLVIDSPNADHGPEELWLPPVNVPWEVEIRTTTDGEGRYELRLESIPNPSPAERRLVDAVRLVAGSVAEDNDKNALQGFLEALEIWHQADKPYQEALTLLRVAEAAEALSFWEETAKAYGQAAVLLEELGDRRLAGSTLRQQGRILRLNGSKNKALAAYERALGMARQDGDRLAEARAVNSLAILDKSEGRTRTALRRYEEALGVYQELGSMADEAATLQNIGRAYSQLGLWEDAQDVHHRAFALYERLGNRHGMGMNLLEEGWILYHLDQVEEALLKYQQALPLLDKPRDRGILYDRLGSAYRAQARWRMAHDAYAAAQRLAETASDIAHTTANRAELLLAEGRLDEALALGGDALEKMRAIGDRHGEAHVLYLLSRIQDEMGNLEDARSLILKTLSIVDVLRRDLIRHDLSLTFFESAQKYQEHHVDLLMRLHAAHPNGGFDVMAFNAEERSRSHGLLENLAARALDEDEPPEIRSLRQQISDLAWQSWRRPTEGEAEELSQEIDRLEHRLEDALAERLAAVESATVREPFVDLHAFQQELDAGTLLLAYALGERHSVLWAVDRTSLAMYSLPAGEVIETLAWGALSALAKSRRLEALGRSTVAADELAEVVLKPVLERLDVDRLVVLGDGALHAVPFAALPGADGEPLVTRSEVVRIPSLSVLTTLRRRAAERSPPAGRLAMVADPVFDPGDERLSGKEGPRLAGGQSRPEEGESESSEALLRAAAALGRDGFVRLPDSRREAETILALFPTGERLAALGLDANLDLVRSGRLAGYRILHFATHGILHDRRPDLSGLVLSLVDENGHRQDGFLRAQEISGLSLPADLVVLSACETARGRVLRAEGVLGLPRSFFDAGATRLLVSLWKVDDEATARLMTLFYQGMLGGGLRPAAALRSAQLALRREPGFQAPAYWAGLELQGEWR